MVLPVQNFEATFPPIYYDSPVNQIVFGFEVPSDDSLTAEITVGVPYFKVSAIDVCNFIDHTIVSHPYAIPSESPTNVHRLLSVPEGIPTTSSIRHLSAPVATSDGVKPLAVKQGQYVRLWITANVPKGDALLPGKFTGTVVLAGKIVQATGRRLTKTVILHGTYLGTLMGKVIVQPETVVPGQPVLVQVCDALGKPLSDPTVTVTIQGVQASARYYQFSTVGSRNFIVRAVRGELSETTQITINIAGNPLKFRSSLTLPTVTEMPMLQVASVSGQPYAATFTLGNTSSVRRVLADAVTHRNPSIAHATPTLSAAAALTAVSHVPSDALGAEFAKVIETLPADRVIRLAPKSIKTATGTATSSAIIAAVGGLQTDPIDTKYLWNFGDGQTLTTQSPIVTHDYLPAIHAGKIAHSFDVTCTIVHDNLTVKRTLVLHSAYELCRRRGVIVPPVTGHMYATFQRVAFSASLIVHNLESSPITLNSMACVPISDDATVALPAPQFTTMKVPVVVAANSASALGVYIPLNQLRLSSAVVNGFAVYYRGEMKADSGTSVPVRFSYVFRIPLSDSGRSNIELPSHLGPASWDFGAALNTVAGLVTQPTGAVSKAGDQIVDPATKTVAIALSANPRDNTTLVQVHSAVKAGLTSIALKTGALTANRGALRLPPHVFHPPTPINFRFDPLNPPPVAANNECYPDDISDDAAASAAAQQLVCQLTNETHIETIPSSFQNAQAGDIILSPVPVGGGDLIAALFRALTPPQHHTHSGIMTANFFEITHCTASPDRIEKNLNTTAGIPTSFNSNMLQYGWPGSITQSIDDAISVVNLNDPTGASYPKQSFDASPQGDGFEIIPPLVVKPLPENEATVRSLLRTVADTARSKGAQYDSSGNLLRKGGCYYSFYGYTRPELSAGFTDAAGADAGWAQGMSPAVCSSFIWLCLKEKNIPLVTSDRFEKLSDFSASAVAGGAQVGSATLDGLIFYPQAERLQGAQALYQEFMNEARSKEYGLGTIPGVNEIIAGPLADQLINTFAFGNPNLVGSSAWKNPGDGNAVSPDNMIWWNPPYYGYAEPLQYLPRHTEPYTISRWTKVISWGSIKGTVRYNGAPVPNAHVWVYLPGGDVYTGADGSYTLNHVPIGPYKLKAQAVITTNGLSEEYTNSLDGQPITLTTANPNIVQDIELQGLPMNYRRADMKYSVSCDHGDANPFNTHGVQTAGPWSQSRYVNPGHETDSLKYSYDYDGGGYFHIDYVITIALLEDLSIEVTIVGTMYDDSSQDVQTQYTVGPFNVPMGGSGTAWMTLEHSNGYHNGPANFTFSVTNNQQTG